MQRVRVGLTGLAVVLLIIALAAAIFRSVGDNAGEANRPANSASPSIDEPLADLGVAPGAATEDADDASAKQ